MTDGRMVNVEPKGELEVVITRSFAAPRARVFAALTDPSLMLKWFQGPMGWRIAVCEVDLRPGGAFRWVWRNGSGGEMVIRGSYITIVPDRAIVHTEHFDTPWYPGDAVDSIVLEDEGQRTLMRLTTRYESTEARDLVHRAGIENGLEQSYARMDAMLAEG